MGICEYSRGNLDVAAGYYEKTWAIASKVGDKQTMSSCALERIRTRWVSGEVNEARAMFHDAINICRESKQKSRLCRGLCDYGQILLDLDEVEEAGAVIEEACAIAEAIKSEIQMASAGTLRVRLTATRDPDLAEREFRRLADCSPFPVMAAEAAYRVYRITGLEADRAHARGKYRALQDTSFHIIADIRHKELAGEIPGPVSLPPPS
jgi:tetratricopeptide (TPR) repeat protein